MRPHNRESQTRAARSFAHKPPIAHYDGLAPADSVYYWWYEYLKRNKHYQDCCESGGKGKLARLYKDFGDVYASNFEEWWTTDSRGDRLFAEPIGLRLEELEGVDDWDSAWNRKNVMVVVIPLAHPKRRIYRWFGRLLSDRHTEKPGKPIRTKSAAPYQVTSKFSAPALEQMLMVYDLRLAEPDLTQSELGKRLRLVTTAMPKKTDDTVLAAKKRNVMSATVGRYLKKAEAYIRNSARGEFPCSD